MVQPLARRLRILAVRGLILALIATLALVLGPGGPWTTGGGEARDPEEGRAAADLAPDDPRPDEAGEAEEPGVGGGGRGEEVGVDGPVASPGAARAGSGTDGAGASGSDPGEKESGRGGPDASGSGDTGPGGGDGLAAVRQLSARVRAAVERGDFAAADGTLADLERRAASSDASSALAGELLQTARTRVRAALRTRVGDLVDAVRAGRALDAVEQLEFLRGSGSSVALGELRALARERGWPPLDAAGCRAGAVEVPPALPPAVRVRWRHGGESGTGTVLPSGGGPDGVAIRGDDGLFPVVPRLACEPVGRTRGADGLALDQAAAALRAERVVDAVVWLAVALEQGASAQGRYARLAAALRP